MAKRCMVYRKNEQGVINSMIAFVDAIPEGWTPDLEKEPKAVVAPIVEEPTKIPRIADRKRKPKSKVKRNGNR